MHYQWPDSESWLFHFSGDWLKTVFALPRPPLPYLPPAQASAFDPDCLDNRDFGWPSTHSTNAVVVPFFLLFEFLPSISARWHTLLQAIAFVWMASICLSRMYLGVHSPADVFGGTVLGVLILQAWAQFGPAAWLAAMTWPGTPWLVTVVAIAIVWAFPRPRPPHASYTLLEAYNLTGALHGLLVGAWLRRSESVV